MVAAYESARSNAHAAGLGILSLLGIAEPTVKQEAAAMLLGDFVTKVCSALPAPKER
jgi:hypothetical protein